MVASPNDRVPNPYVGPRPLAAGERTYGRDRETLEIADLVEAERVLLLHAPSGAGKTSLLQSGVIERLQRDGFRVSGPLRLNLPSTASQAGNRYVCSAAVRLGEQAGFDPSGLADTTLEAVLDEVETGSEGQEHVVVFDQFEEILTVDPSDLDGREQFFGQLAQALARPHRYALFSIREDYMGGLDHHLRRSAGLRRRYRLEFLTRKGAADAISLPALERGVYFTNEARHLLIEQLSRVQNAGRLSAPGPLVEPTTLQVVCRSLWERVSRAKGPDFHIIEATDVAVNVEVGRALGQYYADSVHEVAAAEQVDETIIRDWFETDLITPQGLRALSLTPPGAGRAAERVLHLLHARYLIRSEVRNGATWFELSLDQFIRPIVEDNSTWRRIHLSPWQTAAFEWRIHGRGPAYLLTGDSLEAARSSLKATGRTVREQEREFIRASEAEATSLSRVCVPVFPVVALTLIVIGESLLIAYLLLR